MLQADRPEDREPRLGAAQQRGRHQNEHGEGGRAQPLAHDHGRAAPQQDGEREPEGGSDGQRHDGPAAEEALEVARQLRQVLVVGGLEARLEIARLHAARHRKHQVGRQDGRPGPLALSHRTLEEHDQGDEPGRVHRESAEAQRRHVPDRQPRQDAGRQLGHGHHDAGDKKPAPQRRPPVSFQPGVEGAGHLARLLRQKDPEHEPQGRHQKKETGVQPPVEVPNGNMAQERPQGHHDQKAQGDAPQQTHPVEAAAAQPIRESHHRMDAEPKKAHHQGLVPLGHVLEEIEAGEEARVNRAPQQPRRRPKDDERRREKRLQSHALAFLKMCRPRTRTSRSFLRKQSRACSGVSTMGSFSLKLVLRRTPIPVRSRKASIRP